MDRILLATGGNKSGEALLEFLKEGEETPEIHVAKSVEQARRFLTERHYDLLMINEPLPAGSGEDLARETAERYLTAVIYFASGRTAAQIKQELEPCGVLVMSKPISKAALVQAMGFVEIMRNRMAYLERERFVLQNKIEEIKLVDRAKCVLVQYLSMTEEQAHHFIMRQAMNRRVPKSQVAETVLKTYDH